MNLPGVDDVAAILRTRTTARLGTEQTDTFTANTRPTADQVQTLIERAGRAVYAVIGDWDGLQQADPNLHGSVLDVVATRAAAEVETSYFTETTDTSGSQTVLERRYETDLKRIEQAVRERASGGSTVAGNGMLPLGGFTDDLVPSIGEW